MVGKNTKTLVLLDSHAIIHRAYHALPDFMSSGGEATGALYGLANILMKIVSELKPDYIIACYDLPQKTFRHEAYKEYKAGRAKADDALIEQIKKSREIFEAFNVPIYDAPGFEADDVLGTIVFFFKNKKYKDEKGNNIKIIIASGDMDTMQLVDDQQVQVYTLKKGINDTILYDEKAVVQRFNFKPEFLPDFKGLRGDPSDNIIGIKGIGEKTATTLISKFNTIENIYQALKKKDFEIEFKKLGFSPRVISLLKENEEEALFSKILAQIRFDAPINFKLPEQTFWEKADFQKIEEVFKKFEFRSLFNRIQSFFNKNGENKKIEQLKFFSEEKKEEEKIDENKMQEASIAVWLLNSDITNPQLSDILMFSKNKDFSEAYQNIFKKLEEENLDKIFEEIEKPIIPMVKKMEENGILIDVEYFTQLSLEYHKKLDELTQKIYKITKTEFNINSPKQLAEVLFEKMNIKTNKKRGAGGSFSTKASILEELEADNPIIKEIIAYRELQKLLSTYIDVIPKMIGLDKRLHARFLQNGTTTGRFSSQEPNLQNLPVKTELGKKIRTGFIAPKGKKLISFDYSQIELRVAAILSNDKKMIQIFSERKDIHAGVASFVFGVPLEKVNSENRRTAKIINFGIIYGMGVSALKKNLGSSREEAQKFYDNYFRQFSGVKEYLEKTKEFASKNIFTLTLFNRKRYFPNIRSRLPFLKNMAERTATNAPIQGTAADLIKLAIRYAEEDLKKNNLSDKAHLVLQIHDELVYEVNDEIVDEVILIVKKAMENILSRCYLKYTTPVPLEVNFRAGFDLGEVK